MQLMLNGEPAETTAVFVAQLVQERAGTAARVAVVVNDRVVPAAAHDTTRLNAGDRVELLTFAGGG